MAWMYQVRYRPLPNAIVTQDDGTTTIGAVTVPVSLQQMEIQILSY